MAKPVKVLICYLGALFACTLIFMWLKIQVVYIPYGNDKIEVKTIMLATIIGGIIALRLTVSQRALRIFILIYACLWAIRFIILYAAIHIKEINFFGRIFHLDLIIPGYYNTVSRIGTPLPFIIFWLINHIFSINKSNVPQHAGKESRP
jgi:hypothetical protein